jgi:hypothetical protein
MDRTATCWLKVKQGVSMSPCLDQLLVHVGLYHQNQNGMRIVFFLWDNLFFPRILEGLFWGKNGPSKS